MDVTPYVGPMVTALIAAGGTYAAMSSRLARIEQKVDDLAEDVRRHNGVVERTVVLERDMNTLWKRHDELRQELRDIKVGGTS